MRERRSGLRPVTAKENGKAYVGYFHGFSQVGDMDEGFETLAIVELKDGSIAEVRLVEMKFDDVE